MDQKPRRNGQDGASAARKDKLKQALKANLQKRKVQARARAADGDKTKSR